MKYIFEKQRENYQAFSSGSVIQSFPGQPAFPIRLASELFQRCVSELRAQGNSGPFTIFDPLCGGGYILTCLGFLHTKMITAIYGSDINPDAVKIASMNIKLLTKTGLKQRIDQLQRLLEKFGKESHKHAIDSAYNINNLFMTDQLDKMPKAIFEANALLSFANQNIIPLNSIDIVITDLPYGIQTHWLGGDSNAQTEPVEMLFKAISPVLKSTCIVIIVGEKVKKKVIDNLELFSHLKIGHRHINMFRTFSNEG